MRLLSLKKRFSEALTSLSPSDKPHPLVVTLGPVVPAEGVVGVQISAWLDDAEWAPWAHRIGKGEFSGMVLELPSSTFTPGVRSVDRPSGVKGLAKDQKDPVRTETVLHRRAATAARMMGDLGRPWAAWGGFSPQSLPAC